MRKVVYNRYALYRGDENLFEGTAKECANYLDISEMNFRYLATPAHHKRFAKLKEDTKALVVIKINDEVNEDMLCPVCQTKTVVMETRQAPLFYTTHRTYECPDCLTRFKSSEKIVFTSIPAYIRQKFIDEGKRK